MKKFTNNEKLNIMLLVPMLHQGGFEKICVLTANLLAKQSNKYRVFLTVFTLKDQFYDVPEGVILRNLELGTTESKTGKIVNVVKRVRAINSLIKKEKIDVLYSFGQTANMVCALATNRIHKISALHSFGEIKNRNYMKLLKYRGGQVVGCSKALTQEVIHAYTMPFVKDLCNPYDTSGIAKQAAEPITVHQDFYKAQEGPRIITMGREDDVKGYWHLLKVFAKLKETYPSAKLSVLGDGAFEEYKNLAKQLKIDDSVLFTGMLKNPFPYLACSDVFVLSSISEGLPNVLVEALSLKLPVVSVNCKSGPAEILHSSFREVDTGEGIFMGDYGILTSPLTPHKNLTVSNPLILEKEEEDLRKGIIKALCEKNTHEGMQRIEKGFRHSETYSPESYLESLESLIPTKKTKILFHINSLGKGGAERVISILSSLFAKDDYQVAIATEWTAQNEYDCSRMVKRIHVGLTEQEETKGRIYKAVVRLGRLRKCIKKEKPDIIISFCNKANFRAVYASFGWNIPLLVSVRNDPTRDYLPYKRDTKAMSKRVAGCVFQTKEAKAFFDENLQKKSRVIWNPLDDKYLTSGQREKNPAGIVTAGRITKQKNQLLLIKAYEKIREKYPDEKVYIYGEDSGDGSMEKLQKYIVEHNLCESVKFMGLSNQLEKELLSYKVFVLSSDHEGMPNALMEAMALGLPVIATDDATGGAHQMIKDGENGLLVPVGDDKALSDALIKILSNEENANVMGEKAKEICKEVKATVIYEKWKDYVEELLHK